MYIYIAQDLVIMASVCLSECYRQITNPIEMKFLKYVIMHIKAVCTYDEIVNKRNYSVH